MKMKYIITIHDSNSPDYFVSPYHGQIGTETIVCKNKDVTLAVLKRLINDKLSITFININITHGKKYRGVYFWIRTRDGHRLPDLK